MKNKNRTVQLFVQLILSVLIFFFTTPLSSADPQQIGNIKSTKVAQKKITSEKKVIQKIPPGDVYPGDAAVAGYQEESVFSSGARVYKIEDKNLKRTYIFSEVAGHLAAQNYGYFRVLESYGYGRKEEDARDHLVFAVRTPPPSCKDPVKQACGNPLRKVGSYLFLFFEWGGFAVYCDNVIGGTLFHLNAYVPQQDITDIDGDGHIEFKAFTTLLEKREKNKFPSAVSSDILAIYRYLYDKNCECTKFVRLKGKSFEKTYMEYAKDMKEKKNIFAWLAAVECTENPELIKIALDEFMNLPSPDHKEKQRILEILIRNGFMGLKINGKNP